MKKFSEEGFIEKLSLHKGVAGIGDDCAVIPLNEKFYELITTDLLIEDIHFKLTWSTPADVGYKAVMVNVSDIVACGGFPENLFLSVGFSGDINSQTTDDIISGMLEACKETNCVISGGDTCRSPGPMIINIAARGKVEKPFLKLRSNSKPGDKLCVTNSIGDPAAVLHHLINYNPLPNNTPGKTSFQNRFHRPKAELKAGRILAGFDEVHAMMDISDGLLNDLPKLLQNTDCSADINCNEIPLSDAFMHYCRHSNIDPYSLTLQGGEDYALLVAIKPNKVPDIQEIFVENGLRLSVIGDVKPNKEPIRYFKDGKIYDHKGKPFSHF